MKYTFALVSSLISLAILPVPLIRGAVQNSCTASGQMTNWALTFDDGPININTIQLLDMLKTLDVKVTFHVVSTYVSDSQVQAAMLRAKADGHVIGIRFDTKYATLAGLSASTITSSLDSSANAISGVIGAKPKFVRLPYKAYDAAAIAAIEGAGYTVTEFSVDAGDYAVNVTSQIILANFQNAVATLGSNTKFPFISSQHDASLPSINATSSIVSYLKSAGYNFVTIDACVGASSPYNAGGSTGGDGKSASSSANSLTASAGGVISAYLLGFIVLLAVLGLRII